MKNMIGLTSSEICGSALNLKYLWRSPKLTPEKPRIVAGI
uniref:Uncharacterized protein n=1 Tax=Rhizophora mucronata TaxID=61149 RepID=A0A2P2QXP6_RHIMU